MRFVRLRITKSHAKIASLPHRLSGYFCFVFLAVSFCFERTYPLQAVNAATARPNILHNEIRSLDQAGYASKRQVWLGSARRTNVACPQLVVMSRRRNQKAPTREPSAEGRGIRKPGCPTVNPCSC